MSRKQHAGIDRKGVPRGALFVCFAFCEVRRDPDRASAQSYFMHFEQIELINARHARLQDVMNEQGVSAVLTANPINILYATGQRNMTVFSLMGPFRFALVRADGRTVLWEFVGCEHLVSGNPVVDEVRAAPGITPVSGPTYLADIGRFASELSA